MNSTMKRRKFGKKFEKRHLTPKEKILLTDDKNWWSTIVALPKICRLAKSADRTPKFIFSLTKLNINPSAKDNPIDCECGKFLEIANSVFMQYKKTEQSFEELPQKNVDYGGGVERLLAAVENTAGRFPDFPFCPDYKNIEDESGKSYAENKKEMQIIADHLAASVFIAATGIKPSKTEQGYILRRLIRRALDNFRVLDGENIVNGN